jgi:hypothetical protein
MILPLLFVVGLHAEEPLARALVKSEEWIVRRSPRKEEEFVGDVSYWKGPTSFRADWALFEHETKTWRVRGKIRALHHFRTGDRLEVLGEKAYYDLSKEKGWLSGPAGKPVSFSRTTDDGRKDEGTAGKLEWEGSRKLRLVDGVHVAGSDRELWSERAEGDVRGRSLLFEGGRPVLKFTSETWLGTLKADQIRAWDQPRAVTADGRATGWLIFNKRPKR